ncbi:glycosyl hydrolase [Hymenobacter cavernae]|uniref:Glycosyl hydrolase n=2 Tax=Hymenobacter cavernae TaxID=2044852 RepID=A0ABQ1TTQ8_9BACT|nr:glycosyl hydrolase [Hymenobacter cavernae]
MRTPRLSIIVPTLNEASVLAKTLAHIEAHSSGKIAYEVLICDGGSEDATTAVALAQQVQLLQASKRGRAAQLNLGAAHATGELLYFLHADTLPPPAFDQLICAQYERGYLSGCFRLKFDVNHWILQLSGWTSRFNARDFQFGDQSLYVQKALFHQLGGFNESLLLMEDVEMVTRIKQSKAAFVVMPQRVLTSARKYLAHGVVKTELTHLIVFGLYVMKVRQTTVARVYKKLLSR